MRKEKKKYLNQYLLQEAKIKRLEAMKLLSPDKTKDYDKLIKNCVYLRDEVERKIKLVDGEILSEILFQKYILGKTLVEISYILNYSQRQIERLHIKALEEFNL